MTFDLAGILNIYLWFGVLVTGGIFLVCVPNAERGMARIDHELPQLPNIMRRRYAGMFLFSGFAVWYGDLVVLLAWILVLTFFSAYDAITYFRSGGKYLTHLIPSVLTGIACVMIGILLSQKGV